MTLILISANISAPSKQIEHVINYGLTIYGSTHESNLESIDQA